MDRAVGEPLDRLHRGAGVGPLGVVVEGDAVALAHLLQAVRQALEAAEAGADRRRLDPHGAGEQGRGHGVLQVLHAGERHVGGVEQRRSSAPPGRPRSPGRPPSA